MTVEEPVVHVGGDTPGIVGPLVEVGEHFPYRLGELLGPVDLRARDVGPEPQPVMDVTALVVGVDHDVRDADRCRLVLG